MLFYQTCMVIKYIYPEAITGINHDGINRSYFQEPRSLDFNLARHK